MKSSVDLLELLKLLVLCQYIPIFSNHYVSIDTKRSVYAAVVISILLYGAETWTLKSPDVRILTAFHNCCAASRQP